MILILYTDEHLITYDSILKEYQFKGSDGCRTIFADRILLSNIIFHKEHEPQKNLKCETNKSVETNSYKNFIKK